MNIILFGFKGSGKTHLGKLLSIAMNRPFIDTDDLIVKLNNGRSVREIYQTLGEENFRILEKEIIRQLQPQNAVIALGGGAVLDPETATYLQTIGQMVYLKASFKTIQKRLLSLPSFVDSIESLHQIYQQRLPIYESIPALCIDVDLLGEADILTRGVKR